MKAELQKNGMDWAQAKRESIVDVLRNMRISSFPPTILVGPDGKIFSLNNTRTGEPGLRGQQLIRSLEELIEP